MKHKNIFVACDTSNLSEIKKIIKQTQTTKLKIVPKFGLQFFYSKNGRKFLESFKKDFWLDLKINDIPQTALSAVDSLKDLKKCKYITVHANGGLGMLKAIKKKAKSINKANEFKELFNDQTVINYYENPSRESKDNVAFFIEFSDIVNEYLIGKIKFPHDTPFKKISKIRYGFIAFFTAFTIRGFECPSIIGPHDPIKSIYLLSSSHFLIKSEKFDGINIVIFFVFSFLFM